MMIQIVNFHRTNMDQRHRIFGIEINCEGADRHVPETPHRQRVENSSSESDSSSDADNKWELLLQKMANRSKVKRKICVVAPTPRQREENSDSGLDEDLFQAPEEELQALEPADLAVYHRYGNEEENNVLENHNFGFERNNESAHENNNRLSQTENGERNDSQFDETDMSNDSDENNGYGLNEIDFDPGSPVYSPSSPSESSSEEEETSPNTDNSREELEQGLERSFGDVFNTMQEIEQDRNQRGAENDANWTEVSNFFRQWVARRQTGRRRQRQYNPY